MSQVRSRVRSGARHLALDVLSTGRRVTGATARELATPRVHFVYLHAVPPPELPVFRELVFSLARNHELVGHTEAVRRVLAAEVPGPTVSFSFDDGFESNRAAAQVLEQAGTVGCLFVPTGFVGCSSVTEARAFFGTAAGVHEAAMTWADLEYLVARGHEIGNHTVTHRVLSALSDAEVDEEIGAAHETLVDRLGQGQHFAWPRGRFSHLTPYAARRVFDAGHVSCASAERGSHAGTAGPRPCLRRDHLMTSWPLRHNLYFVASSGAASGDGAWPEDWSVG